MRKIKAVIADDEEQIRRHLELHLQRMWPDLDICAGAANGIEALEAINKHHPDVAFLDIKMPGMSGMQVAAKVRTTCHVVFITAYDHYAIEAFENAAIDFLLKPVTDDRLKQTVDRLKKHLRTDQRDPERFKQLIDAMAEHMESAKKRYLQWIQVLDRDCIQLVPIKHVFYMMACNKYTTVVTKNKEYCIRKPIKEIAMEVDPDQFWQIHRGTIVNVGCISKVSRSLTGRYLLKLKEREETLKVSRTYTYLFKHM